MVWANNALQGNEVCNTFVYVFTLFDLTGERAQKLGNFRCTCVTICVTQMVKKKYVPTPVVKKHQGLADGKNITMNTNPEIVRMDSRKENM